MSMSPNNPISPPVSLLIVHSSADLYGSDRSLLDFVSGSGKQFDVTVALPEHGPLEEKLMLSGARVVVGEVCKLERGMLSPGGIAKTVRGVFRAYAFLKSIRPSGGFDLVYSNSIAVLGGALCALIWRVPHVWHVREILTGSSTVSWIFRRMVGSLSRIVICNSAQTQSWIAPAASSVKYRVVWNGFDALSANGGDRREARAEFGAGEDDVLFVLVGRINSWKGQRLLVEAFSDLVRRGAGNVRLAIVGSAPSGQEHFEDELARCVGASDAKDKVVVKPYRTDVESVWIAADVVVVPSIEPEPFGRVAVEAMGFSRPVIAASHGGLVEIVADGKTGILFPPRDMAALREAMAKLADSPALRCEMGEAAVRRQQELFSLDSYVSRVSNVLQEAHALGFRADCEMSTKL